MNPARVLLEILERWVKTSPKRNHFKFGMRTPDISIEIAVAARLFGAIEERLETLSQSSDSSVANSADQLLKYDLQQWWGVFLEVTGDMRRGTRNGTPGFDDRARRELVAFLDDHPLIEPRGYEKLRSIVRSARDVLESDADLANEVRWFISRLLSEVEGALNDEAVGALYDFEAAAERLYLAFKAAESESTPRQRLWRELWVAFLPGTAGAALVEGGSLVIQATQG